ncbi:10321_t:CDS:2, partial [Racocetra persica]
FGRGTVKNKVIQLEPFSEVSFNGSMGYQKLGNLLNDDEWGSKEDGSGTVAYVLMENEIEKYQ